MISLAGLFSGWKYWVYRDEFKPGERDVHIILLIWGLCWWFGAGLYEINLHVPQKYEINSALFFIVTSAMIISLLARRLQWPAAENPPILLLPVMVLIALYSFILPEYIHPLARWGFISWISGFAVQYFLLKRNATAWHEQVVSYWHRLSLWLLVFISAWTAEYLISFSVLKTVSWGVLSWGLVPAIFIFSLLKFKDRIAWPVQAYKYEYLSVAIFPIVVFTACWVIVMCFNTGDPAPLPYLPVLNPQDIVQLFVLLVILDWLWRQRLASIPPLENLDPGIFLNILAAIAFLWLNALIAHVIHFYAGVRYTSDAMLQSSLFQTSISIVWTMTAFSVMGFATRSGRRKLWFTGAGLLAVVVIKLFLIDLADSGTVARIVSFITVGALMLIIGYLSPVPPKQKIPES